MFRNAKPTPRPMKRKNTVKRILKNACCSDGTPIRLRKDVNTGIVPKPIAANTRLR
jgi:hypothetical protein